MGKGIKVKNADKVIVKLSGYSNRVQKSIVTEMSIAAMNIESKAKVRVPIDTGRLRSSILKGKTNKGFKVGTNVEYAPFVEHGTSRVSARPYLFNSFNESVKRMQDRIKKILKFNEGR